MASCGRCAGAPLTSPAARSAVRESWDPKEGAIAPKTRTSRRTTPVPGVLRDLLIDHRLRPGTRPSDALVFADAGWRSVPGDRRLPPRRPRLDARRSLGRLRLHQARHTYASFMIAAGVNAKALSSFMGHSSIKVTFDLYGHLMPGTEAQAAALLDTYLGGEVEAGEQAAREAEPKV